jgi:hypothetical protein
MDELTAAARYCTRSGRVEAGFTNPPPRRAKFLA